VLTGVKALWRFSKTADRLTVMQFVATRAALAMRSTIRPPHRRPMAITAPDEPRTLAASDRSLMSEIRETS
jgi:hypothetical protein